MSNQPKVDRRKSDYQALLSFERLEDRCMLATYSADFNSDNQVDQSDLAIWETNYGISSSATQAMGDADDDGAVSGTDFLAWQSQYGQSDQTIEVLGKWLFNEGSGSTVSDSSGNGNHGTITYGGIWSTDSPFEPDNANSSLGGIREVVVPNAPELNPVGDFTIETWVKFETLSSGTAYVVSKRGSASFTGYWIEVTPSLGQVSFITGNGVGASLSATSAVIGSGALSGISLQADMWYHIAGVHTATENTLYINGISNGGNTAAPMVGNSEDLTFGFLGSGFNDKYGDNYNDDVRLTNSALDSSQLGFHGSLTPESVEPDGLWLFNEGSGTTIADFSGNGNDAQISWGGGSWSTDSPFEPDATNGSYDFPEEVFITDAPELNPTGPFTVETWVMFNNLGGNPYLVSKRGVGAAATTGYFIEFFGGNTFGFYTADGATYTGATATLGTGAFSGIPAQTGVWYHVAGVFTGSENIIYVNGISSGAVPSPGPAINSDDLTFGSYNRADKFGDLLLDDVRLTSAALAADQLGYTGTLQGDAVWTGIISRINSDIAVVRNKADAGGIPLAVRNAVNAELDSIEEDLSNIALSYGDDFRSIFPLNIQHEKVFKAHALLWDALGASPLTVWQSDLWEKDDHLGSSGTPLASPIDASMMINEYRSSSFNLSNATQDTLVLTLDITGLPAGDNPSYISVHEVEWTDSGSVYPYGPVAAALPEAIYQNGSYQITVYPGLTRQVWLTFHPSSSILPGNYSGLVHVSDGASIDINVPLDFNLYDIEFPDRPTLSLGGWDYALNPHPAFAYTPENKPLIIDYLREHFVDIAWENAQVMPYGSYDAAGNMTFTPDTSEFDAWLDIWPDARHYYVFAAVGNNINGLPMGTAAFDNAVENWTTFWSGYLQSKSIDPGSLGLLLVDEPVTANDVDIIVEWADAIHSAGTGVKIYEDPPSAAADPALLAATDILAPRRIAFVLGSQANRDAYIAQRDAGKELQFYDPSGPAGLYGPYSYYILSAWTAIEYEATGINFWAFPQTTNSKSSWNEYLSASTGGVEFSPFFIDATSVTSAKYMEAIREGIEDYEYFVLLEDALQTAITNGHSGELIDQAQQLLDQEPSSVTNSGAVTYTWDENIDRTKAGNSRKSVLPVLEDLVALNASSVVAAQPSITASLVSQSEESGSLVLADDGIRVKAQSDVDSSLTSLLGSRVFIRGLANNRVLPNSLDTVERSLRALELAHAVSDRSTENLQTRQDFVPNTHSLGHFNMETFKALAADRTASGKSHGSHRHKDNALAQEGQSLLVQLIASELQ